MTDPSAGVGVLAAMAAGMISFLSPCVLPLVPGYLSAVSGVRPADRADASLRRVLIPSLVFVATFSSVFILLGVGATGVGQTLQAHRATLEKVAAVVIMMLGIVFVTARFVPAVNREWRVDGLVQRAGRGGPILAGAAFAIAWTPCVGPTLGAILTAASLSGSATRGAYLMAWYFGGPGVAVSGNRDLLRSRDDRVRGRQAPLQRGADRGGLGADRDGGPDLDWGARHAQRPGPAAHERPRARLLQRGVTMATLTRRWLWAGLMRAWRASRPVHPDTQAALARRWAELPVGVRTDAQLLGRRSVGCEGTHGVLPRCNLACTPCYHAKEAQRVRTDGDHTVTQVEAQMTSLRRIRGTGQHAQLIGGEVSLLDADDHARTLQVMGRHVRKPMSMTHGDFDETYLRRLALDADQRPRLAVLRMAGHFDSLMLGRRGVARPSAERDLDAPRRRFVEMFERLRAEHGVRFDLAPSLLLRDGPPRAGTHGSGLRAARHPGPRREPRSARAAADAPRHVTSGEQWAHAELRRLRARRSRPPLSSPSSPRPGAGPRTCAALARRSRAEHAAGSSPAR